jgi:hypothetical protein
MLGFAECNFYDLEHKICAQYHVVISQHDLTERQPMVEAAEGQL